MWYFVVASNIRVHPFNYLGKMFSEFSVSFPVIFNHDIFRVTKSSYLQCFKCLDHLYYLISVIYSFLLMCHFLYCPLYIFVPIIYIEKLCFYNFFKRTYYI